ncbi:hypothetical protein ABIB50_003813 [Mucilaginibacter sp. UYCu711]
MDFPDFIRVEFGNYFLSLKKQFAYFNNYYVT